MKRIDRIKHFTFLSALIACLTPACAFNPSTGGVRVDIDNEPQGEIRQITGVVNGLWKYDPQKYRKMIAEYDSHLSKEVAQEYSTRYIVRVGFEQRVNIPLFYITLNRGSASEYVLLPEEWTHSLKDVSDDENVVNVGDVVVVEVQEGRHFNHLLSVKRKCNAPKSGDELEEWNIGCKTYEEYGSYSGYAGEKYHFLGF